MLIFHFLLGHAQFLLPVNARPCKVETSNCRDCQHIGDEKPDQIFSQKLWQCARIGRDGIGEKIVTLEEDEENNDAGGKKLRQRLQKFHLTSPAENALPAFDE
ncbi:hypothetical protein D9M71_727870 [compost metagenome]